MNLIDYLKRYKLINLMLTFCVMLVYAPGLYGVTLLTNGLFIASWMFGWSMVILCLLIYRRDDFLNLERFFKFLYVPVLILACHYAIIGPIIGWVRSNIENSSGLENQSQILSLLNDIPFTLWILMVVVAAPIIEELIFRHFLIGQTTGKMFWIRWIVSYVLFVVAHTVHFELQEILIYVLSSFAIMLCYAITRSLASTILLHMLMNAIVVVSLF